jgi:hypothetical protein
LTLHWAATYQLAEGKPVRVPREETLKVEGINACPPRTASVTIDGKLDEWPQLPHAFAPTEATRPPQWSGEADSSYRFAVAHDANYLYIAIKTTDDKSILHPLKAPWSQDGIEVRLDGRADPQRSLGRGRGEMKDILVVSMSAPATAAEPMVLNESNLVPPGVKAVCVKTDAGYAAEIAVPASYLNEKQGGEWKAFRLNIAVDDYDQVAGPLRALWWRPDWRSGGNYSGSGTFQRK